MKITRRSSLPGKRSIATPCTRVLKHLGYLQALEHAAASIFTDGHVGQIVNVAVYSGRPVPRGLHDRDAPSTDELHALERSKRSELCGERRGDFESRERAAGSGDVGWFAQCVGLWLWLWLVFFFVFCYQRGQPVALARINCSTRGVVEELVATGATVGSRASSNSAVVRSSSNIVGR